MANDFSGESNCVALWRFEDGALTADSKGTNTLTAVNTPVADTGDYREGAACVDLEAGDSDYFKITDAALDADFPLKNGDSVKKLTWCLWIKKESTYVTTGYILGKYSTVDTKRSLALVVTSGVLQVFWGYNGGASYETIDTSIAIADGEWYHIGLVVDGIAKTISVRVYKLSNTTVYTYSTSPANELNVEDAELRMGVRGDASGNYDGKIDEIVVFKSLLTDANIDAIRNGTYLPSWEYSGGIPLTLIPQGVYGGSREYIGEVPLTLTPQSICGGSHGYEGYVPLRFTPVSSYEPVGAGSETIIPVSTGGWVMGGAGILADTTPPTTVLPAVASVLGFTFGGAGEADSATPASDALVGSGGWKFCGVSATGAMATTYPPTEAIVPTGGLKFDGAGVWGQVAPEDLPRAALVGSGGLLLSGTGLALDPGVAPTTTILVPTGGWKFGGIRPVPVDVTYPDDLDRAVVGSGGFELGGEEDSWGSFSPGITIIDSPGGLLVLNGAGLCATRLPLVSVIVGEGGFVMAGAEPAEVFEAWCLSGQAFEPSVFSGFNFNSFAVKGGQAYACGDAGIYLLGADHDAGETIQSGARIGPVNFGADREKRIRGIQYGQGGKNTRVRVLSDEGDVGVFVPERDDNRVVVSRDIQGREFTIDIMDFEELSHCEIVPLRLARR